VDKQPGIDGRSTLLAHRFRRIQAAVQQDAVGGSNAKQFGGHRDPACELGETFRIA